jgi:microsomal epoxide hydrolase
MERQTAAAPIPVPFRLKVAEPALTDLRERLARTRLPEQPPGEPWATGTDPAFMRRAIAHWRDRFDWRAQEARLNAFPQYTVPLSGIRLHYLHVPGKAVPGGLPPMPLRPLRGRRGRRLHRGRALAAGLRTVVRARPAALRRRRHRRHLPRTDDRGAWLRAVRRAGRRLGLLRHVDHRGHASGVDDRHPSEHAAAAPRPGKALARFLKEETGYQWIQGTRPQTLAHALTDSPAGLAAWIFEKFRAWTDCDGDPERAVPMDTMLANITLYWLTGAIGSSFWPYYARMHSPWPLRDGGISVPTGYAEFPHEILKPPRSMAERVYTDLRRWTTMPRGGHFAALEQPEALADEIRAFFRPLRGVGPARPGRA